MKANQSLEYLEYLPHYCYPTLFLLISMVWDSLCEYLSQNKNNVQWEFTLPDDEPDPVGRYSSTTGPAASPSDSDPTDAGQEPHDMTLSEFAPSPPQTASPYQGYSPASHSTYSPPYSCTDSALYEEDDVVTSSVDPCHLGGTLVNCKHPNPKLKV